MASLEMPPGIPHWLYGHESNNRRMLIQGIILSPQNHKFSSKPGQGIGSTQTCCRATINFLGQWGLQTNHLGRKRSQNIVMTIREFLSVLSLKVLAI